MTDSDAKRRVRLVSIFLLAFFASCIFQGFRWATFDMADSGIWGSQAEYVLSGDERAYDFLYAYGYGGSVVEGTIITRALTGLPPDRSVLLFITILNSLSVGAVAVLTFVLSGNLWWAASVPAILSLNWLFEFAVPPSALAFTSTSLLFLLGVYIYTYPRSRLWILWSMLSGFLVATRTDIGALASLLFFLPLVPALSWRTRILIPLVSFISLVLFDPFMWYMPIQHMRDLVFKFTFQYIQFRDIHLPLAQLLSISLLSIISIALVAFILREKGSERVRYPIPASFIRALLAITATTLGVLHFSHYQVERYIIPVLLVWELILPLSILTLADASQYRNRPFLPMLLIFLLYACEASFFLTSLLINHTYNIPTFSRM